MMEKRSPRAITLSLPDSERPYLVLGGEKYLLRNISDNGIGLFVPKPFPYSVGKKLNAEIVIKDKLYPIELTVIHGNDKTVGLSIKEKSQELDKIFQFLLEPSKQAVALYRHEKSGTLDIENGYLRLWYETPSGTELLVWVNDLQHMIVAIQFCWFGNWIYREQFQPLHTGVLSQMPREQAGTKVKPDELLVRHRIVDENLVSFAVRFITALPSFLPSYRLWQFLESGEQVYLDNLENYLKKKIS